MPVRRLNIGVTL